MEITLRDAKKDDLPLLLTYQRAYYAHDRIAFDEPAARAALEGLLDHPERGRIWLVCLGAGPIGYVVLVFGYSLEFHGRDGFLDELYLEAASRGRGLGTRTMKAVERFARREGLRAIHLEVMHDNARAQGLYESLGFEGRRQAFMMSKRLDHETQPDAGRRRERG